MQHSATPSGCSRSGMHVTHADECNVMWYASCSSCPVTWHFHLQELKIRMSRREMFMVRHFVQGLGSLSDKKQNDAASAAAEKASVFSQFFAFQIMNHASFCTYNYLSVTTDMVCLWCILYHFSRNVVQHILLDSQGIIQTSCA
jgi:hypothetical protein